MYASCGPSSVMAGQKAQGSQHDRNQLQAHAQRHQAIAETLICETVDCFMALPKEPVSDGPGVDRSHEHENEQDVGRRLLRLRLGVCACRA